MPERSYSMDKFNYEIRNDSVHIEGYVNAVERDSNVINTREGRCVENVTAGAFGEALSRAENVDILLNHNTERKLGSTSEGNLKLYEDAIGLRAETDVTDADVIEKARKGELRGWSFGFVANKTELEKRSQGVPRRHINAMDIYEVSIIDNTMKPCYNGCNVEVRAEGEIEYRGTDVMESINRNEQEQMKLELEMRYNPYHDPSTGRFTSGGGSGGRVMMSYKNNYGERVRRMYAVQTDGSLKTIVENSRIGNAAQQAKIEHIKKIAERDGYFNLTFKNAENNSVKITYDEKKIITHVHNSKMTDPSKNDIYERTTRHFGTIYDNGIYKPDRFNSTKTISETLVKKGQR